MECTTKGCGNPARKRKEGARGPTPTTCADCAKRRHSANGGEASKARKGRRPEYVPPLRIPAGDVQLQQREKAELESYTYEYRKLNATFAHNVAMHALYMAKGEFTKAQDCERIMRERFAAIVELRRKIAQRSGREDS